MFSAGIWAFHFGYDNDAYPSMERAAQLINNSGMGGCVFVGVGWVCVYVWACLCVCMCVWVGAGLCLEGEVHWNKWGTKNGVPFCGYSYAILSG